MGNAHGVEHGHSASGSGSDEPLALEDEATFFDASHNGLPSIPSDAFDIPRLEKIMLQANQLHDIPEVRPWRMLRSC